MREPLTVVFQRRAAREIDAVDESWQANRRAAPDLFVSELDALCGQGDRREPRTSGASAERQTFADGTTSSFDVDTSRGPNYKDFRAYALAKSQCFAMIDVSPAYKRGDKFKVTDTFDHTHYLEASSKGGREFLPPGPLPETARFESTLLTLRKVPCEIVNGAKAREAFEATLNSK